MFNDTSSLQTYLATRRSGKPKEMAGPRPDADEMTAICEIAMRTPDHGKLAPWRFVIVADEKRGEFRDLLERAFLSDNPGAREGQVEAGCQMANYDAALVIAIFSPGPTKKIPLWEQQLSCGAAVMNLEHAAHAKGWVAGWLTGWPATNDVIVHEFCEGDERIAGLVFIGTPGAPQEERDRPDAQAVISRWRS